MHQRVVIVGGHLPLVVQTSVPWSLLSRMAHSVYYVDSGIRIYPKLKPSADAKVHIQGDWDSIPKRSHATMRQILHQFPDAKVHIYDPHKRFSDGVMALEMIAKRTARTHQVVAVGMREGRMDHEMANLLAALKLQNQGAWDMLIIVGAHSQVICFRKEIHLILPKGTPCAVIQNPFCKTSGKLEYHGLAYPLRKEMLTGFSHGISNTTVASNIKVRTTQSGGVFLVIGCPVQNLGKRFWEHLIRPGRP